MATASGLRGQEVGTESELAFDLSSLREELRGERELTGDTEKCIDGVYIAFARGVEIRAAQVNPIARSSAL